MQKYFEAAQVALSAALNEEIAKEQLETPPDFAMGDISFPCFRIAKSRKIAPNLLANEAGAALKNVKLNGLSVSVTGPYINFQLTTEAIAELLNSSSNPQETTTQQKDQEVWVVEYSSPNVAKPFQIYHLRTTIVGAALARIAAHCGHKVVRINHLGDWGTQYGKLAVGLDRYQNSIQGEWTLDDLVRIYVQIHKDMETEPDLILRGQENFKKLENHDPAMIDIWKKCVEISMRSFNNVYAQFDVGFDHLWGESHYEKMLRPLLAKLKEEKILIESEGAWVVPVSSRDGKELPPCILEKSDGATIYATRDVAAAIHREETFHFDRMIYVVGKEQQFHFEQVFGVLRAMGFAWEKKLEHLATGLYRFRDSKMSTRKGNFVTLEEVLALCKEKALDLMRARENERVKVSDEIAQKVAIGALVFADLSTDPTKDLDFDVDRVISFEGETGPYVQYATTRCGSILRKGEALGWHMNAPSEEDLKGLKLSQEWDLARRLIRFPAALERVLRFRKPSHLASYMIDLVHDFGAFYRDCVVLDEADKPTSLARLALVRATHNTLSTGLKLLGIPIPEKM
jgi:arginyl-tRNA synthetase